MLATSEQLAHLGRVITNEAAQAYDWWTGGNGGAEPLMTLDQAVVILGIARGAGVDIGSRLPSGSASRQKLRKVKP